MDWKISSSLLNGKKNILWGGGKNGILLLFVLISQGIYVEAFCDIDEEKQRIRIFNKKVLPPQLVIEHIEEYNIIVTPEKEEIQKEIVGKLSKAGILDFLVGKDIKNRWCNISINKAALNRIIKASYNKKIIIYGANHEGKSLSYVLEMLDVRPYCFIDNVEREVVWEKYSVKPLMDLLDEDANSFVVVVVSEQESNLGKLEKMGLQIRKDYNLLSNYGYEIPRKNILDPNLGYNFKTNYSRRPGFIELGDEKAEYSIACLGGSATDGNLYSFKSWPQLLYEKFQENGYNVRILNGGCLGYKSSQELIKLIRDVIPQSPDLVISYSGINDATLNRKHEQNEEYPFLHHYQMDIVERMVEPKNAKYGNYLLMENSYTWGVSSGITRWEQYKNNVCMMESICKSFNISFQGFLQPCLAVKQGNFSRQETELIINEQISQEYRDYIMEFYNNLLGKELPYALYDMTKLFDKEENVYLDICHVNEYGNRLIAEFLYEFLSERRIIIK